MKKSVIAIFAAAMLLLAAVSYGQTPYLQDFESLSQTDGQLAADGWLVYGNIFDAGGNFLWGHGPWPAPNNIGNWCDIVIDEGGPDQEMQQLVMYSDYGNADHGVGNLIESNLFQEQILPAGCSGTWTFTFDAKLGNLGGASTAAAFIKILDPNNGWSGPIYTMDMTSTPATWTGYSIAVDVTGLDGQYLQFGFMSTAANYEPCGIFYDNVAFTPDGTVATEETTMDGVKAMYR